MKILAALVLFFFLSIGESLPGDISYTLQLEYACRSSLDVKSCEANIIWNDQIVASLNPSNSAKYTLSISVKADAYRLNVLQIEATGLPDGKGLTMDNIKLFKDDDPTKRNIVVNGGFEEPVLAGSNELILTTIKGWYIKQIKIRSGSSYNPVWNSQVVDIDSTSNNVYSQAFSYISNSLVPASISVLQASNANLDYILEFDWVIRSLSPGGVDSYQGAVVVNNILVATLYPSSTSLAIKHNTINLKLVAGLNSICFDSAGPADRVGIVIDNVKLYTSSKPTNILINGDFQYPVLAKGKYSLIKGGIKGWASVLSQVGDCALYSAFLTTGQCMELSSNSNQRHIQKVLVKP